MARRNNVAEAGMPPRSVPPVIKVVNQVVGAANSRTASFTADQDMAPDVDVDRKASGSGSDLGGAASGSDLGGAASGNYNGGANPLHWEIAVPFGQPVQNNGIFGFGAAAAGDDNSNGRASTELLKVMVRFMQYLLLIGATNAPWPALVASMFQVFEVAVGATGQGVVSVDCLLRQTRLLPVAAQEALLQLALPMLLLAALMVAVVVVRVASQMLAHLRRPWLLPPPGSAAAASSSGSSFSCTALLARLWPCSSSVHPLPPAAGPGLRRRALSATVADAAPRLAAATVYILFPHLIRVPLSAFACIAVDRRAGKYFANAVTVGQFWVHDTSQQCWVGWHRVWALTVGVVGTLLFCFVAPAALAALLLLYGPGRRRGGGKRFGIFFGVYRRQRWWWEIVVCLQTEAIVAVSVMAPMLGAYTCLLLLTSVFVASLVLQLIARPHRHISTHRVQLWGWAILTTACMATLGLFNPTAEGRGSRAAAAEVFSSVLGVSLVVVIAAYLAITCATAAWRLRAVAHRVALCALRWFGCCGAASRQRWQQ